MLSKSAIVEGSNIVIEVVVQWLGDLKNYIIVLNKSEEQGLKCDEFDKNFDGQDASSSLVSA